MPGAYQPVNTPYLMSSKPMRDSISRYIAFLGKDFWNGITPTYRHACLRVWARARTHTHTEKSTWLSSTLLLPRIWGWGVFTNKHWLLWTLARTPSLEYCLCRAGQFNLKAGSLLRPQTCLLRFFTNSFWKWSSKSPPSRNYAVK